MSICESTVIALENSVNAVVRKRREYKSLLSSLEN